MTFLTILLLSLLGNASPRCAVDVQPKLANAPLRYIRSRVTIEPDDRYRGARLVLVDRTGHLRSSEIAFDVRTQWIEWKDVRLGNALYAVALDVYDQFGHPACHAEGRIQVGPTNDASDEN